MPACPRGLSASRAPSGPPLNSLAYDVESCSSAKSPSASGTDPSSAIWNGAGPPGRCRSLGLILLMTERIARLATG